MLFSALWALCITSSATTWSLNAALVRLTYSTSLSSYRQATSSMIFCACSTLAYWTATVVSTTAQWSSSPHFFFDTTKVAITGWEYSLWANVPSLSCTWGWSWERLACRERRLSTSSKICTFLSTSLDAFWWAQFSFTTLWCAIWSLSFSKLAGYHLKSGQSTSSGRCTRESNTEQPSWMTSRRTISSWCGWLHPAKSNSRDANSLKRQKEAKNKLNQPTTETATRRC